MPSAQPARRTSKKQQISSTRVKKNANRRAKVPKPKPAVNVEKQCGVSLPDETRCARALTCRKHGLGMKRAVPGRSLPFDQLLQKQLNEE